MLSELLSRDQCSVCKVCCSFDSYDLWETPVIAENLARKIVEEVRPQQQFIKRDGYFLLRLERELDCDLYYCTMLDRETGCVLGDEKPFDCRIWPFRIMLLNETRVISISPVCSNLHNKPLVELIATAENLAPRIFEEADKFPAIVKPYIHGYPILYVEKS